MDRSRAPRRRRRRAVRGCDRQQEPVRVPARACARRAARTIRVVAWRAAGCADRRCRCDGRACVRSARKRGPHGDRRRAPRRRVAPAGVGSYAHDRAARRRHRDRRLDPGCRRQAHDRGRADRRRRALRPARSRAATRTRMAGVAARRDPRRHRRAWSAASWSPEPGGPLCWRTPTCASP